MKTHAMAVVVPVEFYEAAHLESYAELFSRRNDKKSHGLNKVCNEIVVKTNDSG